MYTATVTVGATATSVRDLVNTAVPGEIPPPAQFTGRAYKVVLTASAATVLVSSRGDTPPANNAVAMVANVPLILQSPTHNQVSIDEIFLSGAGTCGVMILVL
jgi:hypothetical protein